MNAVVIVRLNTAGQKTHILAGGDGQRVQRITIERDHPDFAAVVEAGAIQNGAVILDRDSYHDTEWDHLPTVAEVLADDARKVAEKSAEEEAKRKEKYEETLQAVKDRRTTKHKDSVWIDEGGARGETTVEYETISLPYNADKTVFESIECQTWKAELHAKEVAARAEAEVRARADLEAKKILKAAADKATAEKASKVKAWRETNGLEDGDVALRVEDGALSTVPPDCWESHKRGKNWLAVITVDPTSPGGLRRLFATRAKGSSYYMLPKLEVGDAVEFGADYYSGGGRKNARRWHGFFLKTIAATDERSAYAVFREESDGKSAVKAGEKFAAENGRTDATEAVAAGFARINNEGGITYSSN